MSQKIYEVVDSTWCEQYFTLGLFATLDLARQAIHSTPNNHSISEYVDEGYEEISVKERVLGWCGDGKVVYKVGRERTIYGPDSEYIWITKELEVVA